MASRTIVKHRGRKDRREIKEFPFTEEMIPALSLDWNGSEYSREYRRIAWDAYNRHPYPTTNDEAWRRTDIRGLRTSTFRLANDINFADLPPAPSDLLQPLVGGSHSGQLLITSDRTKLEIASEITSKGVIFSDLQTAEIEHPEVISKIM